VFSTGNLDRDSSVGIATSLSDWTVRESNSGEDEIFRTRPDRPLGRIQPPIQWVPGFYGE